jgi:hypothetical protein
MAWYWHRVVPLLERANHEAIAVDLPGDDERAGLDTYAVSSRSRSGALPRRSCARACPCRNWSSSTR